MDVSARNLSGDPLARSVGEGDTTVERYGEFQGDVRTPPAFGGKIAGKAGSRGNVIKHFGCDPGSAKPLDALSCGPRIGVVLADHDPGRANIGDSVRAGRATARLVCAGFERHIERRTCRIAFKLLESHRLGVRSASGLRPAAG